MSALPSQVLLFAPMARADLDLVAGIERSAYEFPWTRGNFADSLTAGYGCWVARSAGHLVGYAVMMQVLDEVHLLNITIAPDWQRIGYGLRFLDFLRASARAQGAAMMFLEVRPSNPAGLALYARAGFRRVGTRRGYYPARHGREDAYVMRASL